LLLLLFVGSGCAALIYEIVWLQLLQLVIGSTAVSLGVLLGTFMGGMCLGSLLLPRVISAQRHPLRVYAVLELGIGVIGLAVLFGMPYVEYLYALYGGHGLAGILLRAVLAGVCLLPPTLLMGATLPAIARWVETSPQGVAWLGFFYGGNIAGAVFGCLLAGFYLLRLFDMATATYVALGINLTVALAALALSATAPHQAVPDAATKSTEDGPPRAWSAYAAIALSGMAALGAEVVWTRLISLLLGGTVYTFSLILAVFLIGLGIGSSMGAFLARRTIAFPFAFRSSPTEKDKHVWVLTPRLALAACQLLLTAAIAWTAFMVCRVLPNWPINPVLSPSPWVTFHLDLDRCLWAVLPPACLWGASFPLALACAAVGKQDPGRLVGEVYAANTIGAIFGALGFSILVIPALGTVGAQRILIVLSAAAALIILAPAFQMLPGSRIRAARLGVATTTTALLLLAAWFVWNLPEIPWSVVAFGRYAASQASHFAPGIVEEKRVPAGNGEPDVFCTYLGEGMNVSVAVTKTKAGVRAFHGAGKIQASTDPPDMRLQRMLGHLSALLHKKPEQVLVVACGAGVTAGTFVLHPDVQRVVICDIEPLVPTQVTPMFGKENYHVVDGIAEENPHMVHGKEVAVVYDDGRHYIHTCKAKFDIITSDPIDPWVKGCAALNTVEYYQMCKDHLKPGGIMSLWIPLYECNEETARSVIATFFKVFPNGILWSNDPNGRAHDAVLFGQAEPTVIDLDALQRRLSRPDHQPIRESLVEVGFGPKWSPVIDLLATFAGEASQLREWTQGAQINTDRNLRLQYLAGMWFNSFRATEILANILHDYRFPDRVFVGSGVRVRALKEALKESGRQDPGAGP
jgi:spermidine synthase